LAALLHDLGKAHLEGQDESAGSDFSGHEIVGSRLADALLQRLRLSNRDRDRVVGLVTHHVIGYAPSWSDADVRRWIFRVGPQLVGDLCDLARADVSVGDCEAARDPGEVESLRVRAQELQVRGFPCSVRDLAVDGHELMRHLDMKPGSELGRILQTLLEEVVADPARNSRGSLLARARELRSC
jgi:hypothetical protein